MDVQTEWKDGKYPSFNIGISSKPGNEPFIIIRGCKIIQGQKGEFISYPARKMEDGKYFNHVYGSDAFNKVVLEKAKASKPAEKSGDGGFDDMDNSPF